jgi:hypothetical protein
MENNANAFAVAFANLTNAIATGNRRALVHFIGENDAILRLVTYMVIRAGPAVRNPAATLDWLVETYGIDLDIVHPLPIAGVEMRPLVVEAICAPRSMEILPVLLRRNPALFGPVPFMENALLVAISVHNHNAVLMLMRHTRGSLVPFRVFGGDIMTYACQTCNTCASILWRFGVYSGDMDPQVLFSHLVQCGAWARVFHLFKARSLGEVRYLIDNTPLVDGAKTRRTANANRKQVAPTWLKDRLARAAALPSVEVAPTRSELCNIVRCTLNMDLALFKELGAFLL